MYLIELNLLKVINVIRVVVCGVFLIFLLDGMFIYLGENCFNFVILDNCIIG